MQRELYAAGTNTQEVPRDAYVATVVDGVQLLEHVHVYMLLLDVLAMSIGRTQPRYHHLETPRDEPVYDGYCEAVLV